MPAVQERPITQLNKEVLVAGLLPTIWMIGVAGIVVIAALIIQPKGLGIIKVALVGAVVLAIAVPIHRVSRTRFIKHWRLWNDSGIGGLQGRDLNPVPHLYAEVDQQTQQWADSMRQIDAQRGAAVRREMTALKREENRFRNVQPKARRNAEP